MKPYPRPPEGLVVEHGAMGIAGALGLRLNRPDRRNAITDDMVLAMIEIIEAAGSDEDVRALLITGTGDDFCSGFDLSLRRRPDVRPRTGSTQRQLRWHVNRLIPTILETQTPVVVAARGWVIGLGLSLALAADFCVVAEDARLRAPFVASGFTPDSGASWLLPRLAGVARAREVLLLDRTLSGAEAADWGLVHRAVDPDSLEQVTGDLVARLAAAPTVALGLAKLLVNRSGTVDLERHLAEEALALELSSRSEDFAEAARARRERRDPDFGGR